jgi:hypothetical protein
MRATKDVTFGPLCMVMVRMILIDDGQDKMELSPDLLVCAPMMMMMMAAAAVVVMMKRCYMRGFEE